MAAENSVLVRTRTQIIFSVPENEVSYESWQNNHISQERRPCRAHATPIHAAHTAPSMPSLAGKHLNQWALTFCPSLTSK